MNLTRDDDAKSVEERVGPFYLGFRVLGKKTGQKRELNERKKRTKTVDALDSKQHTS